MVSVLAGTLLASGVESSERQAPSWSRLGAASFPNYVDSIALSTRALGIFSETTDKNKFTQDRTSLIPYSPECERAKTEDGRPKSFGLQPIYTCPVAVFSKTSAWHLPAWKISFRDEEKPIASMLKTDSKTTIKIDGLTCENNTQPEAKDCRYTLVHVSEAEKKSSCQIEILSDGLFGLGLFGTNAAQLKTPCPLRIFFARPPE